MGPAAADELRKKIGSPLPANERVRHDRWIRAARDALETEHAFALRWGEGCQLGYLRRIETEGVRIDRPLCPFALRCLRSGSGWLSAHRRQVARQLNGSQAMILEG